MCKTGKKYMKLRWIIIGGGLLFALPKTRKILLSLLSDFIETKSPEEKLETA